MKHILSVFVIATLGLACGGPAGQNTNSAKAPATRLKFEDVTRTGGINFTHVPTRTANKWLPEIMGSGLVIADFNRDGAPDLICINSGSVGAETRPDAAKGRLYINDGKGLFSDRTGEWGLISAGYGMGAAVGDYDNDGWTDVFLTSLEGDNRLLRNTGGKFRDVTASAGIKSDGKWATSAGFFDMDSDGDLDIYVVRYVLFDPQNAAKAYQNRVQIYPTPVLYEAVADQIWRNEGDGRFSDYSRQAGIAGAPRKGLALAIGDIDTDGDADVYVANDTDANQLWINDGTGKFKDIAQLAGSAYSETGRGEGSMGADFSDVDKNGRLDIAVTNFQDESTAIYSQTDPLLFREISDAIGIGQTARARLKFGIDFFDADNDGDEDLMVANGHIVDNIDQNSETVTFAQRNSLYENLGNGRFTDVSTAAGDALADVQVSRGLATGDLNGDGALDFIVSNNGGTAQVGFNATTDRGNFIVLWLEGDAANRNAIGARVVARVGDRTIERQIMGAQSYLSVSDLRLHFGLGPASQIDELTIHWPGGEKQTLNGLAVGRFYHIVQGGAPVAFIPGEKQIALQ